MCGLAGLALTDQFRERMHYDQYLVLMSILGAHMDKRGGHSWGRARWEVNTPWTSPIITRDLGDMTVNIPGRFRTVPKTEITHTRFKTVGDITVENAHPFVIGQVVGAHNGSVYNYSSLETQRGTQWSVDSKAIFHYLDQGWPLDEISAYGAITYAYLNRPNKVYLSRFNNGDLTILGIGTEEATDGLIWCSTDVGALHAAEAAGLRSSVFKYEVKENHLYMIDNGRLFLIKPEVGIKKNFVSTTNYYGGNTGYRGGYRGPHGNSTKGTNSATTSSSNLGPTSRFVQGEIVTDELIKQLGLRNADCDQCNEVWMIFYKPEKLYFCAKCYQAYVEDNVDNGYEHLIADSDSVRTRTEIMTQLKPNGQLTLIGH